MLHYIYMFRGKIGIMKINLKHNPYYIAEIGINHNGRYSIAKKMIIKAIKAGANAVKFQKDVNSL